MRLVFLPLWRDIENVNNGCGIELLCCFYLNFMLSVLSSLSGLPVVVENVPGFRRLCILRTHLRHLLLCQQGKKSRGCSTHFTHLQQAPVWYYCTSRNHWVLSGLLSLDDTCCHFYLCCHQGIIHTKVLFGLTRLNEASNVYVMDTAYVLIEKGSTLCPLLFPSGLLPPFWRWIQNCWSAPEIEIIKSKNLRWTAH